MGFLDKIKLHFATNTIRKTCKVMIDSYKIMKPKNPGVSQQELYALALSLRLGWKRTDPLSFTQIIYNWPLTIEKSDKFKDVVVKVIGAETLKLPDKIPDPNLEAAILVIRKFVDEEFKDFKE